MIPVYITPKYSKPIIYYFNDSKERLVKPNSGWLTTGKVRDLLAVKKKRRSEEAKKRRSEEATKRRSDDENVKRQTRM